MRHVIKTTSEGFECSCGQVWPVPSGESGNALVSEASSNASRHADEANNEGLRAEEARREAEYRARRKAERREEFTPVMLALVSCGIASRSEKKPKDVAKEALGIVEALFEIAP